MDIEDVMKALAHAYWGRPASDAELVAMVAETVWLGIDNDKPLWLYYEQPRLELKIAMLE
mgnify:CR=1 FL=1